MNKKRIQFSFDIDGETKKRVRIAALMRNISMNKWVMRAIMQKLTQEEVEKKED